jgi:hypothetical protein
MDVSDAVRQCRRRLDVNAWFTNPGKGTRSGVYSPGGHVGPQAARSAKKSGKEATKKAPADAGASSWLANFREHDWSRWRLCITGRSNTSTARQAAFRHARGLVTKSVISSSSRGRIVVMASPESPSAGGFEPSVGCSPPVIGVRSSECAISVSLAPGGQLALRDLPNCSRALFVQRAEHDPEKWTPVFRKDHAPSKS